jgi:hypothetical protein
MLDTQASRRSRETAELIVVWASSNGVRCVLAVGDGVLELRLERDGKVLRRAHYTDIRRACDTAQRWRIDWDIETRLQRQLSTRTLCPACGDDAVEERDAQSRVQWFRCASCGDVWTLDACAVRGH